jgi:hypothetical protein
LSIAAGSANGRTSCGQSGASPVSMPPLSAAEPTESLPAGEGLRRRPTKHFLGRWSKRGAREGRLIGGGCLSGWWAVGEGSIWGEIFICQARAAGNVFPT